MDNRLLIFFNGSGPPGPRAGYLEWRDEQGRTERQEEEPPWVGTNQVFDIKQAFSTHGMPEDSGFQIIVSNPTNLIHWLRNNDATQLSSLKIFSSATDVDDDARVNPFKSSRSDAKSSEWQRLFELLATDCVTPNLKCVEVFWDCADGWRGLGTSVGFVRALGKLRPKEQVTLSGFYALNWPDFLRREMGVAVIIEDQSVVGWRAFQRGTEGLVP